MEKKFHIQRASERHGADFGWLKTHYSFSFADYYDPKKLHWGALCVFNDDRIAASTGFDMHPHADMEILTYVLSGDLTHQDSMKNSGVVKAGCVQYMSAGTGVMHAEFNRTKKELHVLQMWVKQDKKFHQPQYGQKDFSEKDRTGKLLLVASGQPEKKAPIFIHQNASLYISRLNGHTLTHALTENRLGFLFVCNITITANGQPLEKGDAVCLTGEIKLVLTGNADITLWDLSNTSHE
jgi:quercetin 2,3-dioxygenase